MSTALELQQERNEVRSDLLAGKKPKRIFIVPSFTLEAACGLANISLIEAHYDMGLLEKALAKVCETFYSDVFAVANTRFPPVYQILKARNWITGSNGAMQHPEIEIMYAEDYDEFIAAPYKTMVEKFLSRACSALDTDPVTRSLKLATAYGAYKNIFNAQNGIIGKLATRYGYVPGMATNQLIEAPFDFLADILRGFKGITMDIRRCPDKVKAAVEVITPLMVKMAVPVVMRPGLISHVPLHMAPYINMKAFEELYWPTFEQMIVELDKKGIACLIIAEQDFTRYCEYLARLPKSTIIRVEAGDPKRFTETVGRDHVFGGFYDPTITLTRSKEECIDEAKRLLDVCTKSDHYFFNFDRAIMDTKSIDVSKVQAVLEWVRENGTY
ncbi:MAG: hypothetical protein LBS48_06980 [Treponema sp.]|jgi:hypothetical protein|nr:hypothetical protein [Treponema sp.]